MKFAVYSGVFVREVWCCQGNEAKHVFRFRHGTDETYYLTVFNRTNVGLMVSFC